uniref:Uncharacterized protein n=1 Tax=Anguilla anguilla TaxID=7936 RepID=A0A0E9RPE9_ANGAN
MKSLYYMSKKHQGSEPTEPLHLFLEAAHIYILNPQLCFASPSSWRCSTSVQQ